MGHREQNQMRVWSEKIGHFLIINSKVYICSRCVPVVVISSEVLKHPDLYLFDADPSSHRE